ncbi:MAG: phage major capsid protein, partial [Sphaerochaetaceae bacterium]|nr:phage major capsid protein [Sphaerochaetaceae bacterium]
KGRASNAYKKAFWARLRTSEHLAPEVRNALEEGNDSEGGYLVPDEFERTLIDSLKDNCIVRNVSHIFTTASGLHKIPVVASHGEASWLDEEATIPESDDSFGQVTLSAHKIGTLIKISEELLNDSAFDLESYVREEFSRRMGVKEEEAFLVGNGTGKPTGIFDATGGGQIGITTAATNAITADELIDLFYSLRAPYRRNAVFMLNETTVKAIRKLKDSNGNYIWQPGLKEGEPDLLLGKRLLTSNFIPELGAGKLPVAFGDFNYYWIGDRQGVSFKRLNELYAVTGQVGFLATQRVDGKLILPEAVKLLKNKASA